MRSRRKERREEGKKGKKERKEEGREGRKEGVGTLLSEPSQLLHSKLLLKSAGATSGSF
jgi:hypothetical protein